MKIFVTGATGWIGSATVPELLGAGHQVVGLARSDASAKALESAGATVFRGGLDDPGALATAAAASDGVIHLAFQHEVAFGGGNFADAAAVDRQAVEAMGTALAGSDRPFVLASGMLGLTVGTVATENDGLVPGDEIRRNPAGIRHATGLLALSLRGIGVRSTVLRLPPTVHGDGDNGFIATFVALARAKGASGFVGDGSNRWPAVHRSDAARLARLAVESAPGGSVLHAAGDEGVPFREIAEAMGRHLNVPTEPVAPENAIEHFGYLGVFAGLDSPASSAITRELLGWKATGPTLLEDLADDHYYRGTEPI